MSNILNLNNILRSKGPIRNKYALKDTESCSNEQEIINLIKKSNNLIFIRNGSFSFTRDLLFFSKNINLLNNPIILITSDGDRLVPYSYPTKIVNNILNSKLILAWYTQNYDNKYYHPKLKYLPIGFDLHTNDRLINNSIKQKINFMINLRIKSPTNNRISNLIFSDTHFSFSHIEREYLYSKLKDNPNFIFTKKRLNFKNVIQEYNKYNFVLSPRGRGVDCYRTWELFLAGCIVITRTSSLDDMYLKNNLPVVILKNWEELNSNLEKKLKIWYDDHIHKTSIQNIFPKLTFKYWIND